MPMNAKDAAGVVAELRGDGLVACTMSAMHAIFEVSPSPLNVSSVPLMGGASGLGLGLALSQPGKRVFVLDGDSSLLMQLGVLTTIAEQAPANLVHLVFKNNVQFAGFSNTPVSGRGKVDFTAIALAAGYRWARTAGDPGALRTLLTAPELAQGPGLLELDIAPPQPIALQGPVVRVMPEKQFTRMGDEARAMMGALGTLPDGA